MSLSLSDISVHMKQEAPVFIVGAPRSGTSILYRTLQQHSHFKLHACNHPSGVELTESNIFKHPYNTYLLTDSDAFAYMMKNVDIFQEFLQSIQPIQKYQRLFLGKKVFQKFASKIGLPTNSIRTQVWALAQNDALIRSFLYYAQKARMTERLVEKTPQHITLIPEIRQTFPNAKLLFMLRHPVDVFSSYRRRLYDVRESGQGPKYVRWLSISPKAFCSQYHTYTAIALREARVNPDSFLLFKYEEFTSNLRPALQQILEFLDESFEEACIPKDETQQTIWKADPNLFANIKTSTKNWKEFVTEDEMEMIQTQLSEVIKQVGYSFYTY